MVLKMHNNNNNNKYANIFKKYVITDLDEQKMNSVVGLRNVSENFGAEILNNSKLKVKKTGNIRITLH
jgi:hypothetical protein